VNEPNERTNEAQAAKSNATAQWRERGTGMHAVDETQHKPINENSMSLHSSVPHALPAVCLAVLSLLWAAAVLCCAVALTLRRTLGQQQRPWCGNEGEKGDESRERDKTRRAVSAGGTREEHTQAQHTED